MEDTIRAVAANIRRVRRARGLSLNDLAKQANIAKGTLVLLESSRGNPTVGTLMAIATHLGVTLADLISEGSGPAVHVTRATEGSMLRGDGLELRLVHRMTDAAVMYEIFDMNVSPGRHDSPAHAAGVLEHILVNEGSLKVGPADNAAELAEHDFMSFSADHPHYYEAIGGPVSATLIVVYPVAMGTSAHAD